MKKILSSILLSSLSVLLAPIQAEATTLTGTVYHPWYHGRRTACGQTYQHWGRSVAHPYLPCGTRVSISHRGRTVSARVTDRCNCDIDLSAGLAAELGVPIDGIGRVKVTY